MQLKTGRFGKYFGCTNEACKNTRKLLRSGQAAPPKMDAVPMPELRCEKVDDTYVLRDGASGLFLAASGFPKNRETRAPLVEELLPHRDEIDPKHHYLFDAPRQDSEGRKAVIRFSRKTQEQYVQTEVDGKPTGWRAFFKDGKWKVSAEKESVKEPKQDAVPKKKTAK
jgi:DNA topoisomerase-1